MHSREPPGTLGSGLGARSVWRSSIPRSQVRLYSAPQRLYSLSVAFSSPLAHWHFPTWLGIAVYSLVPPKSPNTREVEACPAAACRPEKYTARLHGIGTRGKSVSKQQLPALRSGSAQPPFYKLKQIYSKDLCILAIIHNIKAGGKNF